MKVLVTGGAGYIGSHAVKMLVEQGHDVVVIDSLEKGHRKAVHPKATLLQGDLRNRDFVYRVFDKNRFDAVMHFAGFIEAGESMQLPERFMVNNTAGTYFLLEAMLQHDVKRFIFASTAATYGEPVYTPIDEQHPTNPTNHYGFSKLQVEQSLRWLCELRGLGVCCFRFFNASGCSVDLGEDHHHETHLIPLVLQTAAGERTHISIFGTDYPTKDGTCIRDYVHVLDLAQAFVLALKVLELGDWRLYNVGTGNGYSVREVIDVVKEVTGKDFVVQEHPRRAGDSAVLVASSDLIRKELGWSPKHDSLQEIVRSAWLWKQKFPHGYEKH
jgi:UDP-glucose 4-epimerase